MAQNYTLGQASYNKTIGQLENKGKENSFRGKGGSWQGC